jgi:hypothetical protein
MVRALSSENDESYEVPDVKIQWTRFEKLLAKIISLGIMISLMLTLIGGLWSLIDIFILYMGGYSLGSFFNFFLDLTSGVQILLIFASLAGVLFLGIAFIIFLKKGYKFILHLLFKIEA